MTFSFLSHLASVSSFAEGFGFLCMLIVIMAIPRPQGSEWKSFRTAVGYLTLAYFIMMMSDFVSAFMLMDTSVITKAIIMVVASYQALLFTIVSLVFIHPNATFRIFILSNIIGITLASILLFVCTVCANSVVQKTAFWTYVTAYIALCAFYTYIFMRNYRGMKKALEEFYDDEMEYRFHWIRRLFFEALFVGALAVYFAIRPEYSIVFSLLVCIFYAVFLVSVIRYQMSAYFIVRGTKNIKKSIIEFDDQETDTTTEEKPEPLVQSNHEDLKPALDRWVAAKCFTKGDIAVEDVAKTLGVSYSALANYFCNNLNTSFRVWRTSLRIEEAKRLLRECPELSINDVLLQSGFIDRTNFYRHFNRIVGMPPTVYREQSESAE